MYKYNGGIASAIAAGAVAVFLTGVVGYLYWHSHQKTRDADAVLSRWESSSASKADLAARLAAARAELMIATDRLNDLRRQLSGASASGSAIRESYMLIGEALAATDVMFDNPDSLYPRLKAKTDAKTAAEIAARRRELEARLRDWQAALQNNDPRAGSIAADTVIAAKDYVGTLDDIINPPAGGSSGSLPPVSPYQPAVDDADDAVDDAADTLLDDQTPGGGTDTNGDGIADEIQDQQDAVDDIQDEVDDIQDQLNDPAPPGPGDTSGDTGDTGDTGGDTSGGSDTGGSTGGDTSGGDTGSNDPPSPPPPPSGPPKLIQGENPF